MGYTIKHAALSYARKGWKVFPISPNLKTPLAALAPQGHKNATSDQTTIEQWWSAYPNANIGLNLEASGLVCVDVAPGCSLWCRGGGRCWLCHRGCGGGGGDRQPGSPPTLTPPGHGWTGMLGGTKYLLTTTSRTASFRKGEQPHRPPRTRSRYLAPRLAF